MGCMLIEYFHEFFLAIYLEFQAVLASRSRVFQKMLYQAPSPQRKKEPPPRENKLRLFLKRSSEPLLNLQNAAQQVTESSIALNKSNDFYGITFVFISKLKVIIIFASCGNMICNNSQQIINKHRRFGDYLLSTTIYAIYRLPQSKSKNLF